MSLGLKGLNLTLTVKVSVQVEWLTLNKDSSLSFSY